ncbi:MAG: hypothetical protein EHM72_12135, partial [Calditrichaeota bacterium]
MKRGVLVLLCLLAATQFVYAGGILTNTNHSAQFVRMFARNASTEVDAVYYNPAGVVQMGDGFYIALHNQVISQTKKVESSFPLLAGAPKTYQGDVFVPAFPDVYAVYKKGAWAFHFGFGPNAGGGSAEFNDGLPSFEQEIAKLPIGITTQIGMPTSKYSSEIAFKGSSAFYGYQVGASYAMTKKLGVSLGVRYLQAVNTYEGSITNIMVNPTHPVFNPTGAMISASAFFNQLYQATVAMGAPNPVLLGYAKNTADKQVDAKQTGSGITPIIGLNYQFSDKVSAGLKYELQTALELTNETTVDDAGLFPDGEKSNSDVPAILAGGVAYKPIPKLLLALSGNYYFDTAVSWES